MHPIGKAKNSVGIFWNRDPRVEIVVAFLQRFVTPNLYITQIPYISDLFFYLIPATTGAVSIIYLNVDFVSILKKFVIG
jgi:hypothetical protein